MNEVPETQVNPEKPAVHRWAGGPNSRPHIKPSDVLIILFFLIIVIVLTTVLIDKLIAKRDTANARTVSDAVIADIQDRNGAKVYALGTPTFQRAYTADGLTQEFQHITIATLKPPAIDQQAVVDSSLGRTVFFVYKYTALKVPYYIRTSMLHRDGKWQLTSITGNADESQLLID